MRVVLLVLMLGCSSDVDLTGVYEVSSSVGGEPCGNDQPVTTTPPFLKFYQMEFFGQEYFAYDGCTDAGATECDNIGGLFGGFSEGGESGWTGATSFALGGSGSCTLGYLYKSATLSGKDLVIDESSYSEETELEGDACSAEAAGDRGRDMPCIRHARIEARKID